MTASKSLLWIECLLVFAGVPVIIVLDIFGFYIIILLFFLLLPASIWLFRNYGFNTNLLWCADKQAERKQFGHVVGRFFIVATLIVIIIWLFFPQRLLDLPSEYPTFWLILMFVYPLFSVYPQELLYRTFFFLRYQSIFPAQHIMILVNAALFSWVHIIFNNLTAVLFTLAGGMMFAHTYQKTHSLRLVSFEHALYGALIMTVGYAQDFLNETLMDIFGVVLNN